MKKALVLGVTALALFALLAMSAIAASAQLTIRANETPAQLAASAACVQAYSEASAEAADLARVSEGDAPQHLRDLSVELDDAYIIVLADDSSLLCGLRLVEGVRRLAEVWRIRADALYRKRDAEHAARIAAEVEAEIASAGKD